MSPIWQHSPGWSTSSPVEEECDGGDPDGEYDEQDGGLLGADQGAAGGHGHQPRAVGGGRGGRGRRGGRRQVNVVLVVPVVVRPSHPGQDSL